MTGYACVFQTDPDITDPSVMSLAWFSEYIFPGVQTTFKWTIDYSFVWADTGQLVPGVTFMASEILPADLQFTNQVTLAHTNGAYHFTNQTVGAHQGSLFITEDPSIPQQSTASVGIGMSGNGTFAVQAEQNMHLTFTPHPTYWIAFGDFTEGMVLDITQMTGAVVVKFPQGEYSMAAVLGTDNRITVTPTTRMNARLAAAAVRPQPVGQQRS